MADEEQLRILRRGAASWIAWRLASPDILVDLSGADLGMTDLSGLDLDGADLSGANLRNANLIRASLSDADLREANLIRANLALADLCNADLTRANLNSAELSLADLTKANLNLVNFRSANLGGTLLREADLRGACLYETILSKVDLSACKNLESVVHNGPSILDIRTLQRSGPLPLAFLRGVGLPDTLIEYLPSLLGQTPQHYSCFISYSSKDGDFARKLHTDLQDKGVRCWFAPHDMKIGAKILDTLDEAIRLRDKVLLVLSEASIASEWVEDEVTKAFEEERQRGGVVLFPVRVDDAVLETREAWASKLRRGRHIGDFRGWKDHDTYQKALERVLRDLRVDTPERA
jgi:hypothetical protein